MKDDYVTKKYLDNKLDDLKNKFDKKLDKFKDDVTENTVRAIGVMFEDFEDKMKAIVKGEDGTAERSVKNSEKLDKHEEIINRHDLEIKNLQEVI